MKTLYLPVLAAMLAVPALSMSAEEMYLSFTTASGTVAQYALSENPVLTVNGDNFVITTAKGESNLAINEVKTFTFTNSSGVEKNLAGDYKAVVKGGIVSVKGADVTGVTVYNAMGMQLATAKAAGGAVSVDLNAYPAGVYFVVVPGHETIKVKK